jgi:hypothetical protein
MLKQDTVVDVYTTDKKKGYSGCHEKHDLAYDIKPFERAKRKSNLPYRRL